MKLRCLRHVIPKPSRIDSRGETHTQKNAVSNKPTHSQAIYNIFFIIGAAGSKTSEGGWVLQATNWLLPLPPTQSTPEHVTHTSALRVCAYLTTELIIPSAGGFRMSIDSVNVPPTKYSSSTKRLDSWGAVVGVTGEGCGTG